MGLRRRDVVVDIDRLVLEGVPAGDRLRVAEAVREELARRLAGDGLPSAWTRDAASLDVTIPSGAPASPEARGATLARAMLDGSPPGGKQA